MYENPVLIKEIKTKIRSRQSRTALITGASVLGVFIVWCYYEALSFMISDGGMSVGRDGWSAAVIVQSFFIWLLCPALAVNAVTQEKEQQTWEMLVFTLLTPVEILGGKLLARLIPIATLLAAFLPFMLFCFFRSDLSAWDFAVTYLVFSVWVLFLVTVSLFSSWAFRKTAIAIAFSYLVLFVLVIGTLLVQWTISLSQPWGDNPIMWLNPGRIVEALLDTRSDAHATEAIAFNIITLSSLAAFLFWRMITRFRTFALPG